MNLLEKILLALILILNAALLVTGVIALYFYF